VLETPFAHIGPWIKEKEFLLLFEAQALVSAIVVVIAHFLLLVNLIQGKAAGVVITL